MVPLPLPFAVLAGGSLGICSSGLPPLGLARSANVLQHAWILALGLGLWLVLFLVSSIHLVILYGRSGIPRHLFALGLLSMMSQEPEWS